MAVTCVPMGNLGYELKTVSPVLSSTSVQKNSYTKNESRDIQKKPDRGLKSTKFQKACIGHPFIELISLQTFPS